VGSCARVGYAQCELGVFSDTCVAGAPSTETCNGADDNCDGTVDNAAVPTGTPALSASRLPGNAARLTWTSVALATSYDIVRGSLQGLRSSGGNFTTATTNCLGNDLPATTVDDTAALPAGGAWYVLRAANCGGSASYNTSSTSQIGSRDAEIAASGVACP